MGTQDKVGPEDLAESDNTVENPNKNRTKTPVASSKNLLEMVFVASRKNLLEWISRLGLILVVAGGV